MGGGHLVFACLCFWAYNCVMGTGDTLFSGVEQKAVFDNAPLAVRMRPRDLDEFAGQEHFVGEGKLLRRMLDANRLTSVIFYGPPQHENPLYQNSPLKLPWHALHLFYDGFHQHRHLL